MRARFMAVVATAVLATALTGCDSVKEATNSASNAADKAGICVEAVRLAGFNPDASNPEKTAQDAEKTATDLTALAEKTADTSLKDALNGMSAKVNELSTATISPATVTAWAKEKVSAVDTLSQACL